MVERDPIAAGVLPDWAGSRLELDPVSILVDSTERSFPYGCVRGEHFPDALLKLSVDLVD